MMNIRDDLRLQLEEKHAKGEIGRREFLFGLGMLGFGTAMMGANPALADSNEVVVANYGGDATTAMNNCFAVPFMKAHPGTKVTFDGSGPTPGHIKSMVESGSVTWDVVDRNIYGSIEFGQLNLLEEIDYSIVDRNKILPGFAGKWGVGSYTYAMIMTWDSQAFNGRQPRNWADFWNVKDFPGKRALQKKNDGILEAALLADGVPADKLYPLDVDRAFRKVRDIKDNIVWWTSFSDSAQLLRDGEATMGILVTSRAVPLRRDTNNRIQLTYEQGIYYASAWSILKGNPAGKKAQEYIAATQDPAAQVEFLRLLGNGPINPAANALITPELQEINPSAPEHLSKMIVGDNDWYAANEAKVLQRFFDEVILA